MNLEKNINLLKQNFIDCGDFVIKKILVGGGKNIFFCVAYIDMLVDRELIDTQIITRLTRSFFLFSGNNIFGEMKNNGFTGKQLFFCTFRFLNSNISKQRH